MTKVVSLGAGTVTIYDAMGSASTWKCHGMTLQVEDARPDRTRSGDDRPRALRSRAGVVITLPASAPEKVRAEYQVVSGKASRPSQAQWKRERKGRP